MNSHDGDPEWTGISRPDVVAELLADDVVRAAGFSDDDDLAAVLHTVRDLGHATVPKPSPDLAALLAQGLPQLRGDARRSRRRRTVGTAVVAGILTLGLTGVAAANNRLPPQAQSVVSRVVNDLTPFTIDPGPRRSAPGPKPVRPAPAAAPSAATDDTRPTRSAGSGESPDAGESPDPTDSPQATATRAAPVPLTAAPSGRARRPAANPTGVAAAEGDAAPAARPAAAADEGSRPGAGDAGSAPGGAGDSGSGRSAAGDSGGGDSSGGNFGNSGSGNSGD